LEHGIAANIEYPLPASFVWQVSRSLLDDLPEQHPLGVDVLTWKVFGALPELKLEPAFESLRITWVRIKKVLNATNLRSALRTCSTAISCNGPS